MFLYLANFIFLTLSGMFLATQVISPAIRGTEIFPYFRSEKKNKVVGDDIDPKETENNKKEEAK